jgi:exopolyphosphatase/guanosine-5'-triphosphate,3'-diphosphate pyrophosphatase
VSWRSTRAAAAQGEPFRQVAVIDLGSNSWRLVVYAFVRGSWWKQTDELYETVRISAGMAPTGWLQEDAMARGLETLTVFDRFCAAARIPPERVHAVATSAIREASNGAEFVEKAQEATRLWIEILPAEEEARLGYVAAVNTSTLSGGAVLELGGGSLQMASVADRRAEGLWSLPIGSVGLTEEFLPGSGPAKKKELERLRAHLRERLSEVIQEVGDGRLVGIGGAVRNLAAAAQRVAGHPDIGVQGFLLEREMLGDLVERLAELPVPERREFPGIKPGRGDIVLAAAVTIDTVLELGAFAGIEATEAGLREGLFFDRELFAHTHDQRGPLFENVRESAVRNLAVQYESDMVHVEHVALLALQMFDSLVDGGLIVPEPGERELLWAAAMLHDVGMTINYDDHHKHSRYLIVSAELPGFDPRERALIAQITRYHRKGAPKLGEMAGLAREGDEELVARCAVLVRLAEHLERGRDQSVHRARLRVNGDGVDLHLDADGENLILPRWSVERYGDDEAFEKVFGRRLLIG